MRLRGFKSSGSNKSKSIGGVGKKVGGKLGSKLGSKLGRRLGRRVGSSYGRNLAENYLPLLLKQFIGAFFPGLPFLIHNQSQDSPQKSPEKK